LATVNHTLLVFSAEVPTASLSPVVHAAATPGPSLAVPAASAVSNGFISADATSTVIVAKTIAKPGTLRRARPPIEPPTL
jgi:hypothetical protein